MELTIIEDKSKKLFGLKNSEGEIILEKNYSSIRVVKNYNDLSFQNYSYIYLLSKNKNSNLEFFSYLKDGKIVISEKEYIFSEFSNCESHFYKNLTICKIVESEEIIIDLNEEIIGGPYEVAPGKVYKLLENGETIEDENLKIGGGWFECGGGHNINYAEKRNLVAELCRSYDSLTSDFGYGNQQLKYFYKERNEHLYYLTPDVWPLQIENSLGLEYSNISSQYYNTIYRFDLSIGISIVKDNGLYMFDNGVYKFINKFFKEVGERFDYPVTEDEFKEEIENVEWDPKFTYIEKDGKILKIKFTGDYVKEACLNPTIFVKNENLKSLIRSLRFVDDNFNTPESNLISKIDEEYVNDMYINEQINNKTFERTIEWENQIYTNTLMHENCIDDMLPFKINRDEQIDQLLVQIDEFNELFGITYSGYEVIEVYNKY